MSTEDCKALLVRRYPATVANDWKREKKFFNHHESEVRIFRHIKLGRVWVIEDEEETCEHGAYSEFQQISALRAEDFYVWAHNIEPGCVHVFVVLKSFFDLEGQAEDVEIAVFLAAFFPTTLKQVRELEGGAFRIGDPIDKEAIMLAFLDKGFLYSEGFHRHIESEYPVSK